MEELFGVKFLDFFGLVELYSFLFGWVLNIIVLCLIFCRLGIIFGLLFFLKVRRYIGMFLRYFKNIIFFSLN